PLAAPHHEDLGVRPGQCKRRESPNRNSFVPVRIRQPRLRRTHFARMAGLRAARLELPLRLPIAASTDSAIKDGVPTRGAQWRNTLRYSALRLAFPRPRIGRL